MSSHFQIYSIHNNTDTIKILLKIN